jgi:hypothetical protein
MSVEINRKIYAVTCGMVASGYDLYTSAVGDIYWFAQEVANLSMSENVRSWFEKARTGQVAVNPYWPRGHAVLSAAFFTEGKNFDIDGFMSFFDNTGVSDPIGRKEFIEWISQLPLMLEYMDEKASSLWEKYCGLFTWWLSSGRKSIEEACKISNEFFGDAAMELSFIPNPLYSPFATDFVRIGNKLIVIGHSCDAESMLHEALHIEIAKYRDKITTFINEHGYANFANFSKMIEMGYINQNAINHADDYKPAYAHVIEECFVRGISTALAEGGARRLSAHANEGFGSVPAIGLFFEKMRPKADCLGEFMDYVFGRYGV